MKILTWAAVAVTALFALMNLGSLFESGIDSPFRIASIALGVAGLAAATGLAARQPWGRAAVIGVGAANVAAAIVALFADQDGGVVGIVVGGLAAVLGVLSGVGSRPRAEVAR